MPPTPSAPRALALLICVAAALAGCATTVQEGAPAPAFEVKGLTGEPVTLANYTGRVLLLDFMASYCGPCQEEAPAFKAVHARHQGAVEVLMVSVDPTPEEVGALEEFRDKFGLPWTLAQDATGKARADYGVTVLPTLVVVDKEGRIAGRVAGETLTEEAIETLIRGPLERPVGAEVA